MTEIHGKSFTAATAWTLPTAGELVVARDEIQPPRLRPLHRLTVWLSAAILLLLTLAYAALALTAGWIGLDYLISHLRLLASDEPVGEVLLYVALAVAVLFALFFVLLPAFQFEPAGPAPIIIVRSDQPLLFDFVERLCQNLHLQPPDQIRLVLGTNASASLEGGLKGLFTGKTVLTLGLTLTAGVSIQQFGGIVAHELGHFAQHREMRLQWLIHSINGWFARVIYSRGRVDYWLHRLSQPGLGPLRIPFYAARGSVWLGRAVLWIFMWLAHAASCLIARQSEFESDQHLARAAGSDGVRSVLQHVLLLDIAADNALSDLEGTWRERRLADNIPALAVDRAGRLTEEQRTRIIELLRAQSTGWFDTHPCFVDRIRASQGSNHSGMVRDERPASLLLSGFEDVCRRATLEFYSKVLGDDFTPANLVPAGVLIEEYAQTHAAHESLRRYFQGEALLIRPIFPTAVASEQPANVDESLDVLEKARERMGKTAAAFAEASVRYVDLDNQVVQAVQVGALAELGLQGLPPESAIAQSRREFERSRDDAEKVLAGYDQPIRDRLSSALSLLRASNLMYRYEKLDHAALLLRVDRLLAVCGPVEEAMPHVHVISAQAAGLFAILRTVDFAASSGTVRSRIVGRARIIVNAMEQLRRLLGEVPYPFEHQSRSITSGGYVVEKLPDAANPVDVAFMAMEVLQRADSLISRTLANLASFSEQVESALGFEMLNPPPQVDPMALLGTEIEEAARHRPAAVTVGGLGQLGMAAAVALMVGIGIAGAQQAGKSLPSVIPRHAHYQPTITSTQWYSQPPVWQGPQHPSMPGQPGYTGYPGSQNPNAAGRPNDPRYPGYDPAKPAQYYPPGKTPQPGQPGQPSNNPTRPSAPWTAPSSPRPGNPTPYRPGSPSSPSRPSPGSPSPGPRR